MFLRLRLFTCSLFLLLSTLILSQSDNGNECSCFKTNGSSAEYFTYHRFHDFRNINLSLASQPDVLTDANGTANAPVSSEFFETAAWIRDWAIQTWNNSDVMGDDNATVLMINSANNIYIERSSEHSSSYSTYLTLRTTRTETFQSAAEFDSTEQNFHYLSARFLARVIGSPGSCAGMFTYLASSPIQEADIEILTSGPRDVVQYTNQPSNSQSGEILPDATRNASIPSGLDWGSWNIYRMDWSPRQSTWYVNGQIAASISFQVPQDPAGLIVNMWSDGGPWTGNMSIHNVAHLQIQYIEVAYNTSGSYNGSSPTTTTRPRNADSTSMNASGRRSGNNFRKSHVAKSLDAMKHAAFGMLGIRDDSPGGCKVVCSVDDAVNASNIGTPIILYNNTGSAASTEQFGSWYARATSILLSSLVSVVMCL